jgi:hypothetical protein
MLARALLTGLMCHPLFALTRDDLHDGWVSGGWPTTRGSQSTSTARRSCSSFMPLTRPLAAAFARVAVANVTRPYPHKLDHLLTGPDPGAADPVALHPVFYGSYDWHSAVHMHWLLVRILRLHPDLDDEIGIAATLTAQFLPAKLAVEQDYLASPVGVTFERPYGWAWLLALEAELTRLARCDTRAGAWRSAVAPLADGLAARLADFFRRAVYPIRVGTHANTAFAGLLAADAARERNDPRLAAAIHDAARRWYAADRDARPAFEPSLTDFLSPILCEAALMAEVLAPAPGSSANAAHAFAAWLAGLLPEGLGPLATRPVVPDRADPQVVHLDGLCLSRAWCLRRIADALPADHPLVAPVRAAAASHLEAGLPQAVGGDYVGEHWLASFAALALE